MLSISKELSVKELIKMNERLKKDLGIRAILALILVVAAVGLVSVSMVTGENVPEAFMTMVGMVVQAYFTNRGTLDKPQK